MPAASDELRSFHEFVGRKLAEAGAGTLSLDEALELWHWERRSPREEAETLEAIRRGLEDLDAGRTRPARDVLAELRRKSS